MNSRFWIAPGIEEMERVWFEEMIGRSRVVHAEPSTLDCPDQAIEPLCSRESMRIVLVMLESLGKR